MSIHFFFASNKITLDNRKKLKVFICHLFIKERKKFLSLAIVFCTDQYLLSINNQFLHHDFYTDIITFNLSEPSDLIEGEIYISIERVKENAAINKVSISNELHRVIFHGVLHLCGYKDKSTMEKVAMSFAEDKYLRMYFTTL